MRKEIKALFKEVGKHFEERDIASLELHESHDVHAFYRITKDPSKVIHVQGYPGLSSTKGVMVWARMMDYNKMMEIRDYGDVSIGNEHEATIQSFPNFGIGVTVPYMPHVLIEELAKNCPELR